MTLDSLPRSWSLCRLLDIAWELGANAEDWLASHCPVPDPALFTVWQTSRAMCRKWLRQLDRLIGQTSNLRDDQWVAEVERLAEEFYVAELLSRVAGTVIIATDRSRETSPTKPILEQAHMSLAQVRFRLEALLLDADELLVRVDRLRRRFERWTDVLIGPLLVRQAVSCFACDARRCWDFGEERLQDSPAATALWLCSYRAAFRTALDQRLARTPGWTELLLGWSECFGLTSISPTLAQLHADATPTDVDDAPWTIPLRVALKLDRNPAPTSEPLTQPAASVPDESRGWDILSRALRNAHRRSATTGPVSEFTDDIATDEPAS